MNFNSENILKGIAAGYFLDLQMGRKIPIATLLGATLSMINISIKKTNVFSSLENKLNLAYLSSAKKEKII